MSSSPSHWLDKVLGLAFTILVVALMLYIAVKLIVSVLPVLIGLGIAAAVVYTAWLIYHFRRSRW
jgi:xanthine/uracil permease